MGDKEVLGFTFGEVHSVRAYICRTWLMLDVHLLNFINFGVKSVELDLFGTYICQIDSSCIYICQTLLMFDLNLSNLACLGRSNVLC